MKLLSEIKWRLFRFVHTNGFLADTVYGAAFPLRRLIRSFHYDSVSKNALKPEELYQNRQLELSSRLITGVTNICNAKCSFCAYPKVVANKTLQTGVMPFETFRKAIDEWAKLGRSHIDLTPVVGDPLLDPGLIQKIDYAIQQAGMKRVVLTTNAILMDRNEMYQKLVDHGISVVCISIQGTSKAVYEQVYGVPKFDEAVSGLHHLLTYNRQVGEPVKIMIRFRNAEKPSEIIHSPIFQEKIKPFLSEKVSVNFTVDFDNWGGTIKKTDIPPTMRLRELPRQINLPCTMLFGVTVRFDGSVRLCGCRLVRSDSDDLVAGNIHQHSLKEIAEGETAWKIIEGFYSGHRPDTCRECTFYEPVSRDWLQSRIKNKAGLAKTPSSS